MAGFTIRWLFGMTAAVLLLSAPAVSQETAEDASPAFSEDQLEQLVAPIALYTDGLVAQIMMASTYPLQVVEAARWVKKNPDLQGDALQKAVEKEDWDPSVRSLVFFPDVLNRMSDDLEWTQDLGDAVLAQQEAVMDAVQRMRRYAYDAGNLKTTEQQQVVVEEKIIKVEPVTQVVYVPAYNPTVIYAGYWAPPYYYYPIYHRPPYYWYPPGYVASNVISFGIGVAVGAALWGGCDWHHHGFYHRHGDVNININRININKKNVQKWEHNPKNRGGVRYRDKSARQKYDNRRREGTRQARIDRDAKRGYDRADSRDIQRPASRDVQRPQTRDIKQPQSRDVQRPSSRDVERPSTRDVQRPQTRDVQRPSTRDVQRPQTHDVQRPSTRDVPKPQTRDVQRPSTRPSGGSSAFKPGNKSFDRAAMNRGSSSRGRSVHGGGGNRGGGGRRR